MEVTMVPACLKNLSLALIALIAVGLYGAAEAGEGAYLDEPQDLAWFVAFSDTHVGAEELIYGNKDLERLEWATTTLVSTIDPAFVVNCGDLTDATAWGLIPGNQVETEWIEYAETVAGNGMDPGFYFDVPGNHDQYGDAGLTHYRTWSVAGGASGTTNHSWTLDAGVTDCLAMGLATCASDGAGSLSDDANLDAEDQAFIADTLAAHPDEDLILVFGHHPVSSVGAGKSVLEDLLAMDRTGLYLYGHTHDWDEFWDLGSLHINIRSLTKSESKNVAVVAVDGGGLSVRVFDVQDWPQILVTAPLDRGLGGNHQQAYKIPWYLEEAPVRALAFDPAGIDAVEWSLDGETWTAMTEVEEHVFQGSFDAAVLGDYPQTLRVRAFSADGGSPAIHEVQVLVDPDAEPPEDPVEPSPEFAEPTWDVQAGDIIDEEDAWEGAWEVIGPEVDEDDDLGSGSDSMPIETREDDASAPDFTGIAAETVGDDVGPVGPIHDLPGGGTKGGCAASPNGSVPALLLVVMMFLGLRLRRDP